MEELFALYIFRRQKILGPRNGSDYIVPVQPQVSSGQTLYRESTQATD
jgi:hypothetical protein